MKDTIVQEVRDARAAIAADFGDDLGNFFTWAKSHASAERKAKHPLPIHPLPVPLKSGAPKKGIRQQRRQTSTTP